MSIKLQIEGYLGKDPYVAKMGDVEVTVLSVACRRGSSRHADWITATVWNPRLQDFVRSTLKKGDKIQAFGVLGKLSVYYDGAGKPKSGLDMFINTIGFVNHTEERGYDPGS